MGPFIQEGCSSWDATVDACGFSKPAPSCWCSCRAMPSWARFSFCIALCEGISANSGAKQQNTSQRSPTYTDSIIFTFWHRNSSPYSLPPKFGGLEGPALSRSSCKDVSIIIYRILKWKVARKCAKYQAPAVKKNAHTHTHTHTPARITYT